MKWLTRSIIPSMAALAALIAFLPRTGPAVGLVTGDFAFTPQALVVEQGEAITIRNDGDLTHSFTCPECGMRSINIQPGQAKIATFPTAGTFEFFCVYHRTEGMEGRVTVEGDAPAAPEPAGSPTPDPSP
ncbi:MAG TPA: cupredoxin domain-containing protein [Actinomycetota bacterium]|nr:cupredoxin domain-containing protein [Actinomycetota bacterium]